MKFTFDTLLQKTSEIGSALGRNTDENLISENLSMCRTVKEFFLNLSDPNMPYDVLLNSPRLSLTTKQLILAG